MSKFAYVKLVNGSGKNDKFEIPVSSIHKFQEIQQTPLQAYKVDLGEDKIQIAAILFITGKNVIRIFPLCSQDKNFLFRRMRNSTQPN